jgi:hypothetical protein
MRPITTSGQTVVPPKLTPPSVETTRRPLASMREPAQTMSGSALETRTSWNELRGPQSAAFTADRVHEPPKSVERHTPDLPTAKRWSGRAWLLPILVMNGALPLPVSVRPPVAALQLRPPSRDRCRPLYW